MTDVLMYKADQIRLIKAGGSCVGLHLSCSLCVYNQTHGSGACLPNRVLKVAMENFIELYGKAELLEVLS